MTARMLGVFMIVWTLMGCASMKIENFADRQPVFELEEYFLGQTRAYGLFEDRGGNIKAEFTVDIVGTMEGDTLVLDEDFSYASGRKEQRTWRIRRTGPASYVGTAADVVGEAEGRIAGNALNWKYLLDLDTGDGDTVRLRFDDWMFLQEDGVLLNRARLSKFGFHVGSVTISFRKVDAGS